MRLLDGKQSLLRHGGAGNRTTVTGDYLTLRQARDVMAAAQHALAIGKPLTRYLTVWLEWQGKQVQRWIERISGHPYKNGTIKTTRVGGTATAHERNPRLYLANLATVVGYVMKGTCPEARAALELERTKPQGRVMEKRCGMSQIIKRTLSANDETSEQIALNTFIISERLLRLANMRFYK